MNVTSFVFISGALLLGKEESYKDWFCKRVLRIAAVIIIFSAIYYDWKNGNVGEYLLSIFSGHITNAFWYLYLYLGIMVLLPFLRKMVAVMTENEYRYMFAIFAVSQGIYPVLVYFFGLPSCHSIITSMFSTWISWIVVFIFGYYLFVVHNWSEKLSASRCLLFLGVWFIGNLIPTLLTIYDFRYRGATYYFMDNTFFIWTICATIAANLLLLYLAGRIKNELVNKSIRLVGSLTFGIYLLGDKLINNISFWSLPLSKTSRELLCCIAVFAVGGVITFVLKHIPLIKKLL